MTYIPQRQTSAVAKRKLFANGARDMDAANMRCPKIHVDNKSGFFSLKRFKSPATAGCGLAVYVSSSGDFTSKGSRNAPVQVMREYMTSEVLPIRPISPRTSLDCFASGETS